MKRFLKTVALLAFVALPALTACNKEQGEDFSFEIQNAEGTQAFIFGETREFPFKAVNVSRSSFEKPDGWEARLDFSAKVLKITAPSGEGAESGTVVVKVYSDGGAEKTAQVNVAASEAKIEFSVDGIADGLSLKYGESVELKAQMANVASVEAGGAKGWKAEKVSDTAVKVTAPSKTDEGADLEGTLTLTPKSGRGTAGSPVSVKVSVKVSEPSVQFDKTEISRVDLGSTTVVKTTELTNVAKLELKSAPKGWTAAVKLAANAAEITVTAPAQGSEFEGIGEIVFLATSDTETTAEAVIKVSLKGINNADDFLALAAAWNTIIATDSDKRDYSTLDPYLLGGEFVMNADIDVSNNVTNKFFNGAFNRVLNGNGHTLTYALEASEGVIGIFDTFETPGVVKNLTVAGSIFAKSEQVGRHGGISGWADGGTFQNITIAIDYKQEGADQGGYFGGINGDQTNYNGGGVYENCHFVGTINAQTTQFMGGIIGDVWDNKPDADRGIIKNCSNEGKFVVNTKGVRVKNMYHGGLVGKCDGAYLKFTDCFNKADMTYQLDGAKGDAEGIAGISGMATGTFTNCYNTGNITFLDKTPTVGWAHVAGFIACGFKAKEDVLKVSGCYNKGNITACGEDISTFIAFIRDFGEGECVIENCYSEGNLDCVFPCSSMYIGGFVSTIYNSASFKNCRFSGTTKGYVSNTCASFVGRACDNVVIDGCESSKNVYAGVRSDVTDGDRPMVSGFVNAWYPKVTITNSTVTGNVFHMCPDDKCVDKVLTSKKVLDGAAGEETSTVDEATLNSAKNVTVTKVAKSDTWPADWK